MKKNFQETRKKIGRKYWFGWAGGYGDSKKNRFNSTINPKDYKGFYLQHQLSFSVYPQPLYRSDLPRH